MRWFSFLLVAFSLFTLPLLMAQNPGAVCIQNTQGSSFWSCGNENTCPPPIPTPSPSATPTPSPSATPCPDGNICITVTDIPTADSCLSNLYAVIFQSFDASHDPANANVNQVAIDSCNGGSPATCTGMIDPAGANNVEVYVYCDDSRATGLGFDNDGTNTVSLQAYQNLTNFNACPREMEVGFPGSPGGQQYARTAATPFTVSFTGTNNPFSLSNVYGALADNTPSGNNTLTMTPGDRFNSVIESPGGEVNFTISDLTALSFGGPEARGNMQTWCNCVLGTSASASNPTASYLYLDIFTGGSPTANYLGFFTDTERATIGVPTNCVLP